VRIRQREASMTPRTRRAQAPSRRDGRSLSHETSAAIRQAAVEQVRAGASPGAVMHAYGLCRTTIYRWLRSVRDGGVEALAPRRHPGRTPLIDERRADELRRWVAGSAPREYGIVGPALWTRSTVASLMRRRLGVDAGESAVAHALERIGLRADGGRLARAVHRVVRRRRVARAFRRAPVFVLSVREADDGALVRVSNPRLGWYCDVVPSSLPAQAVLALLEDFAARARRKVVLAHGLRSLQRDRGVLASARRLGVEPVLAGAGRV
jgi:transposase